MRNKSHISLFAYLTILPVVLSSCGNLIPPTDIPTAEAKELPTFESCQDLRDQIGTMDKGRYFEGEVMFDQAMPMAAPNAAKSADLGIGGASEAASSDDFSTTNVQVEGVDEADRVKTDGQYIYTMSDNDIVIVRALPPNKMSVVSRIKFDQENNYSANEFFISKDKIIVLGNSTMYWDPVRTNDDWIIEDNDVSAKMIPVDRMPYVPSKSASFISIYDLSDIQDPDLIRTVEIEGNYSTSRMIDNVVYAVMQTYSYYPYPIAEMEDSDIVPQYKDSLNGSDKVAPMAGCMDIHYFPPVHSGNFVSVVALDIDHPKDDFNQEIVYGNSENVFASLDNLYITQTEYNNTYSTWPRWMGFHDPVQRPEKTIIHKFNLDGSEIKYLGEGSVTGSVLNQFSMDEHKGYFRIATTQGYMDSSNVYILDENMETVGSLRELAPGERIYSARFMGDRAYLVTFKKVDPLFVLDLSDPKNPSVLGKLKIPGYSDYLHPYDETHIIGIGKDTIEADQGDFAWYQGVKLAIFDVTDVDNPIELHKEVIGDRGTDSPVLTDHKAFLFSREKNLMVIPVTVAEVRDIDYENEIAPSPFRSSMPAYGQTVFQGAYVYNLTLSNGFDLKGKITHHDEDFAPDDYYYPDWNYSIQRTLTIDDNLYTVSNSRIMAHSFRNIEEVGDVMLSKVKRNPVDYDGWIEE
jgi:inhibitor of cysteine peptidase